MQRQHEEVVGKKRQQYCLLHVVVSRNVVRGDRGSEPEDGFESIVITTISVALTMRSDLLHAPREDLLRLIRVRPAVVHHIAQEDDCMWVEMREDSIPALSEVQIHDVFG